MQQPCIGWYQTLGIKRCMKVVWTALKSGEVEKEDVVKQAQTMNMGYAINILFAFSNHCVQ